MIFDLPPSLAVKRATEFRQFVHPVLQASCIKCHNENSDREFQLIDVKGSKNFSGEILRANLDATLHLIDSENLPKSELLSVSLVPHGNPAKKRPIFTGSNDPWFKILSTWVNSLQSKESPIGAAVPSRRNPPIVSNTKDKSPGAPSSGFASERDEIPLPFSPTPSSETSPVDPNTAPVSSDHIVRPPSRAVPGRKAMVYESEPPAEGEFPVPFAVTGQKPAVAKPPDKSTTSTRPKQKLPGGAVPLPSNSAGSLPDLPDPIEPEDTPAAKPKPADTKATPKKPIKIDPKLLEKALKNRNAATTPPPGQ